MKYIVLIVFYYILNEYTISVYGVLDMESIILTNVFDSEPKIKLTTLKKTSINFDDLISYDKKYDVIYFSLKDLNGISSNESQNFLTRDYGLTIQPFTFVKTGDHQPVFKQMYHNFNFSIFYDENSKILYSCTNGENYFSTFSLKSTILTVFFHPTFDTFASIIDSEYNFYITQNSGINWNLQSEKISHFAWHYNSNIFYVIKAINNSSLVFSLFSSSTNTIGEYKLIFDDYTYLSGRDDIVYALKIESSKTTLMIASDERGFRKALFPSHVKPNVFEIYSTINDEIYVLTYTSDLKKAVLYSGLKKELRFTRILDNIFIDPNIPFNIKTFKRFPSIIFAQKYNQRIYSTSISYNHGTTWDSLTLRKSHILSQCNNPDCYLRLNMDDYSFKDPSIILSDNLPNLIFAVGKSNFNQYVTKSDLFGSMDSGSTWYLFVKSVVKFTILNDGGIIVAFDENGVLHYSYDEGITWEKKNIIKGKLKIIYLKLNEKNESTAAVAMAYDISTLKFMIIHIDFEKFPYKTCVVDDYEPYTPNDGKSQCFEGKFNPFYKRKKRQKCLNAVKLLPTPPIDICQCKVNDHKCNFGYFKANYFCVDDKDEKDLNVIYYTMRDTAGNNQITSINNNNSCYIPVRRTLVLDSTIFYFTDSYNIITVRRQNNMSFINLNSENKGIVPIENYTNFRIDTYDVDVGGQCLYYADAKTLNKYCFGEPQKLDQVEKLHQEDETIIKLRFDQFGKNLFYSTLSAIRFLNKHSHVKTISNGSSSVTFFEIFPEIGYIIYCRSFQNMGISSFTLFLSDILGNYQKELTISDNLIAAHYINERKSIIGYSISNYYIISFIKSITVKVKLRHGNHTNQNSDDNMIGFYYNSNSFYTATNDKLFLNNQTIWTFDDGKEARFHLNSFEFKNNCKNSRCNQFCINRARGYSCGCKDGMETINNHNCQTIILTDSNVFENKDKLLDAVTAKAPVNNKQNPVIESQPCRHYCNHTCLPQEKICDNVTDCSDGSDEFFCQMDIKCEINHYKCLSECFCFSITQKCDGYKDCKDGSDESFCKEFNPCNSIMPFKCDDQNCIFMNEYCNGQNNCLNNNDEQESCKIQKLITRIEATSISISSASIRWDVNDNITNSETFQVVLLKWDDKLNTIINTITSLREFVFSNLSPCIQYYAYVMFNGSDVGRSVEFTTKENQLPPITNIYFKSEDRMLFWDYPDYSCLPFSFRVSCINSQYKVQKFTNSLNDTGVLLEKDLEFCNVSFFSKCPVIEVNSVTPITKSNQMSILKYTLIVFGTLFTAYLLFYIEKNYFHGRISGMFRTQLFRKIPRLNRIDLNRYTITLNEQ